MTDKEIEFIKSEGFTDEDMADPTFIQAISRPVCKMKPGEACNQCDPRLELTEKQLELVLKSIAFDSKIVGDGIIYQVRSIDLPEYLRL